MSRREAGVREASQAEEGAGAKAWEPGGAQSTGPWELEPRDVVPRGQSWPAWGQGSGSVLLACHLGQALCSPPVQDPGEAGRK